MSSSTTPPPASAPAVRLLPSGRFFVRRIALADGPAAAQVELALETLSPFPPAQLYYGYALDPVRREALVFAAHRRNFPAEESESWATARAVLPAFAPWLGSAATPAPGLGWRRQDDSLEVLAWDGRSHLPVLLLTRQLESDADTAVIRQQLLDEARRRLTLPAATSVRELAGTTGVATADADSVALHLSDESTITLTAAQLDSLDVRDKVQLLAQRRGARRDLWLWRTFAGCAIGLAACLALECAMLGGHLFLRGQRTLLETRAADVRQIESTQELAKRLGEMSSAQLHPFEMLAVINTQRPPTVSFMRVFTKGTLTLEIEAQTANPADSSDFEARLKTAPGIAKVDVLETGSRDGVTRLLFDVTFKSDFLGKGGGA